MAGHPEPEGDPRVQLDVFIVIVGDEVLQGQVGVIGGIEGFHCLLPGTEPFPGGDLCIGFLDVAAVRQQDLAEFFRHMGAVDESFEPFPDQLGQKAAVVDVGMAEDHGIDFTWVEGKFPPVQVPDQLGTLEHAAVQEDLLPVDFQQVAGACDDFIRSQEGDFHRFCLLLKRFNLIFQLIHL